MENNIFLGLGSNLGNRLQYLRRAVHLIDESEGCKVINISSVYESEPLGDLSQDNYYNAVILIESAFPPYELLMFTQFVEAFVGRKKRKEKWAPREIDVDILFYNQLVYDNEDLKIPHPEAMKRDFVLVPMIELDGDFIHPIYGGKMRYVDFDKLEKNIVRKLDSPLW
jgi:2-amino-4-hydroxy-6-hydroxymethyldihydropteridine diphosphokinase